MSPKIKARPSPAKETNYPPMSPGDTRSLLLLAGLIFAAAAVFASFFQVNKIGALRQANPFLDDPYDAIGSLAVQVALLIALLSYARALRLRVEPAQPGKAGLVLRGDALVILAITITLAGDTAAVFFQTVPASAWRNVIFIELVLMWAIDLACFLAVAVISQRVSLPSPPADLTPGDAIDDLWILVRLPVARLRSRLPARLVTWVEKFRSDRLFARLPWLNPRLHPWRFAAALGLLVGVLIMLAQLQEGLPPSLVFFVLVAGLFLSVEVVSILIGFALLGGFLGLRPPLIKNKSSTARHEISGKSGASRKAHKDR